MLQFHLFLIKKTIMTGFFNFFFFKHAATMERTVPEKESTLTNLDSGEENSPAARAGDQPAKPRACGSARSSVRPRTNIS